MIRLISPSTSLAGSTLTERVLQKKAALQKVVARYALLGLALMCVFQVHAAHGIVHTPDGPVIELSESTLNAIDNGVSLTFVCEFAILREWLFLKWPEQRKQHQFIISKHALSDRYLVHRDDNPTPSIFRSTSQSMAFITKATQVLFNSYVRIKPDTKLRISLSKYDLPAPMRLTAFTSTQWSFDSGWGEWQSVNY